MNKDTILKYQVSCSNCVHLQCNQEHNLHMEVFCKKGLFDGIENANELEDYTECDEFLYEKIDDTGLYWVRNTDSTEFKCRFKISLFGFYPIEEDQLKMSAFDPKYHGPFAEGKGKTKQQALDNLNLELEEQSNAFWE